MPIVPAQMLEPAAPSRAFSGRDALSWLFLFRLVLVSVLILLFSYPSTMPWLSLTGDPGMARDLLSVQAVLVLASGFLVLVRWPVPEHQVALAVFVDILSYTLLMHFSGGLGTGLGLLPAIAVITGALLTEGRLALLFASMATLAVIAEQLHTQILGHSLTGSYTQAGLLGLTYFAVALLAHVLAKRVRAAEQLAARRKLDLADLAQLNEHVIQSLAIGLIVVDGDQRVLLLNDTARDLLGGPRGEPGVPLSSLAPALTSWFQDRRTDGAGQAETLTIGERELLPSLQRLGDTAAGGALLYLRDNREVIREAQEIKLAALGRLTASIAHNIRNPLSSVSHAAQLLNESPVLDAEQRHLLAIIRRNAQRIDETVTSVLALSRRDRAEPQGIDLRAWLEEFCTEYCDSNRIDRTHLQLRADREPLEVSVDPRHLGQTMRNLCDNAFKHGSGTENTARIEIIAQRHSESDQVFVDVVDDGPGIPKAIVREVFEPFFTTTSSGTGLGLYVAREFAQANGLTLRYVERKGAGARFRLSFPDRRTLA
jgi:two-component system, NtrC family, sensor histidine kinase PilS